jgi:threonine/homoserine/homoserine lactone efflux protein
VRRERFRLVGIALRPDIGDDVRMDHVVAVLPEFTLACLVLAMLPGPSTALFLHRTLRDGRRCGLAAVAGNEIGIFCWALAAATGLTVLLQANRLLFDALHIAGAIVLAWLGISAWRSAKRGEELPETDPRGRTPLGAFRASLVSIAANPKAAVFAFAFYPEFLPRHGPVLVPALTLAAFQIALVDAPYCAGVVLLANRIRPWLSRAVIRRRMERALGAVLIALGIELAATAR